MKLKKKKVISRKCFEVCSYYGFSYLIDSKTCRFLKFPDDFLIEEEKD